MAYRHRNKRDWHDELDAYVTYVLKYVHRRPKRYPSLEEFTPKDKNDKVIRRLLVYERRRRRKVENLLDELIEAVENGQYDKAQKKSIEIECIVYEIYQICIKLNKRFLI